jgi:hypothetical protein
MGENSIPSQNIARFPLIFFLGFIVLILAEIMAGSSLLWFLDLSGYFQSTMKLNQQGRGI